MLDNIKMPFLANIYLYPEYPLARMDTEEIEECGTTGMRMFLVSYKGILCINDTFFNYLCHKHLKKAVNQEGISNNIQSYCF